MAVRGLVSGRGPRRRRGKDSTKCVPLELIAALRVKAKQHKEGREATVRKTEAPSAREPGPAAEPPLPARGDALDFDEGAFGKGFDGDCAAGGVGSGEELGVHFVHCGEIAHIGQEHRGLDDISEPEPGGLQNGLGVGQALMRLFPDAARSKGARGGVDGNLAGDEDEARSGVDGLAVRSDGSRRLICLN